MERLSTKYGNVAVAGHGEVNVHSQKVNHHRDCASCTVQSKHIAPHDDKVAWLQRHFMAIRYTLCRGQHKDVVQHATGTEVTVSEVHLLGAGSQRNHK